MKNIAVILAGSGYIDGSEIREAVAVLWAIDKHGATAHCFAPDIPQHDVIDHLTGKPVQGETRNVLHESARIARGKIEPLSKLNPKSFDAIIMPGGFGAAKNLSTFATEGAAGTVNHELLDILKAIHAANKPIGAACIAPAILALAFRGTPLELTVGEEGGEAGEIEKLGHRHIITTPSQSHTDRKHRVVTTPAYMYGNAPIHEVFEGIESMVREVLAMS
jgi:enhancing lycopene biosynthesis protein 2